MTWSTTLAAVILSFARAHATERLDLQLMARPLAPTFPVQMSLKNAPTLAAAAPNATLLEREDCTLVAWYRSLRTSHGRGV